MSVPVAVARADQSGRNGEGKGARERGVANANSTVEDFFDAATKQIPVDGKTFNPTDGKRNESTEYGKTVSPTHTAPIVAMQKVRWRSLPWTAVSSFI